MAKSVRSLVGMSVVCRGRRAGRVAQARLSPELDRMEGLWMDAGLFGARYIPAEHIALMGSVAVIADSMGARRPVNQKAPFLRAVSTDGRRVGAVVDAVVDEMTFRVEYLVLSRGFWEDLADGRVRAARFTVRAERGDVVVEPAEWTMREREEGCAEENSGDL